jgi:hypothetical protein
LAGLFFFFSFALLPQVPRSIPVDQSIHGVPSWIGLQYGISNCIESIAPPLPPPGGSTFCRIVRYVHARAWRISGNECSAKAKRRGFRFTKSVHLPLLKKNHTSSICCFSSSQAPFGIFLSTSDRNQSSDFLRFPTSPGRCKMLQQPRQQQQQAEGEERPPHTPTSTHSSQ